MMSGGENTTKYMYSSMKYGARIDRSAAVVRTVATCCCCMFSVCFLYVFCELVGFIVSSAGIQTMPH